MTFENNTRAYTCPNGDCKHFRINVLKADHREAWDKWFEESIVPMLKKHHLFSECACERSDDGHHYVCAFHFVERIIKVEVIQVMSL